MQKSNLQSLIVYMQSISISELKSDGVVVNQERLQPMLDDPKQFRSQLKLLNQINKIISINEEENTREKDFRLPFLGPF
jgi:hypothetical protein